MMKRFYFLALIFCAAFCAPFAHAQYTPWTTILPAGTGIDWSQAGIPGGIPDASWTQSGSTITTTTCPGASAGSTSGTDCTSTIQTALNSCGTNHFVLMGAGVFLVDTTLTIPSNCVLRGSGTESTILNFENGGTYAIRFGADTSPSTGTSTAISSGASQGSTSIVVASASGYAIGQLALINQTNPSFVSDVGTEGACGWCANGFPGNSGQVVEVTNISGTTLTIRPPLYYTYTPNSPKAYRYNYSATNAGLENLEMYSNNTMGNGVPNGLIWMYGTKYSWVTGVESNFPSGGHTQLSYALGNIFRNNFFHDGFNHGPGQNDDQFDVHFMSSSNLVENNIFYRMHVSVMVEWGAAGNVFGYNYSVGNYHDSPNQWLINDENSHGAHPWFNLWEGDIGQKYQPDTIWGTSSHLTFFRDYSEGSREYYPPQDARGTLGTPLWEDSTNGVGAYEIDALSTSDNLVGVIAGSAHLATESPINMCIGGVSPAGCVSGASTPHCYRFNYSSDNNQPYSSSNYSGTFIHGAYDCTSAASPSGTFQWSGSVTHTLPASFYLSSKPSYLGSTPWPGIGPDITGGTSWSGYVNPNAAQACFNTLTLTTVGSSTAYGFNPATCYATSGTSFTVSPSPVPAYHSGTNITLTLAGSGMTSSASFSISGVSGATLGTCTNTATAGTCQLTTGTGTGTLTLTDTTDSASTTITVGTPSFAISPNSGNTSTTPTVTFTGTNTDWKDANQSSSGLFTLSGGSGASLGTITVTSNTRATATLTVGSSAGTLTLTDSSNGDGSTNTQSFTATTTSAPIVTTTAASSITNTSASSGGTVSSNGGSAVTAEGVAYGTNPSPQCGNSGVTCTSNGTATPFTSSLSPLAIGTTYYYQAYAENNVGTSYGGEGLSLRTTANCTTTITSADGSATFIICGEAVGQNESTAASTLTVNYAPTAGNGLLIVGQGCTPSDVCNGSISSYTQVINDNLFPHSSNPGGDSCFVSSPNSPLLSLDSINDNVWEHAWYCPVVPSGLTSFTLTNSASVFYLQLDFVEFQAGSVATSGYYDLGSTGSGTDNVGNNTTGSTWTATTNGSTLQSNEIMVAFSDTCGGSTTNLVGPNYTGIAVDPIALPGHLSEGWAVTSPGTYTATTTWNFIGSPTDCGGSSGSTNDSAYGIIVPLVGANSVGTVATPTFSPAAGTYASAQSVAITSVTPSAIICWTSDGTTPTATAGTCTHGTTYASAVPVTASKTLKAVGSLSGDTNSSVGSAAYVITGGTNYALTVPVNSSTSSAVSSSPSGILNCTATGGTCSASFASGTVVTLTPTAAPGELFINWTTCNFSGKCAVTMSANESVTATFCQPVAPAFCDNQTFQSTSFSIAAGLVTINASNTAPSGAYIGLSQFTHATQLNGRVLLTNSSTTTSKLVGTLYDVQHTALTPANVSNTADTTGFMQGQGWNPFYTAPFPSPLSINCPLGNGDPSCGPPTLGSGWTQGANTWAFDPSVPCAGVYGAAPCNPMVMLADPSTTSGHSDMIPSAGGETNERNISLSDGSTPPNYMYCLKQDSGALNCFSGHIDPTYCAGVPCFVSDVQGIANAWSLPPLTYGIFSRLAANNPGPHEAIFYALNLSPTCNITGSLDCSIAPVLQKYVLQYTASGGVGQVNALGSTTNLRAMNTCPGYAHLQVGDGLGVASQIQIDNYDNHILVSVEGGSQGTIQHHSVFLFSLTASPNTCQEWDTGGYTGTNLIWLLKNSNHPGTGYAVGDTESFTEAGGVCSSTFSIASISGAGPTGPATGLTIVSGAASGCYLGRGWTTTATSGSGTGLEVDVVGVGTPGTYGSTYPPLTAAACPAGINTTLTCESPVVGTIPAAGIHNCAMQTDPTSWPGCGGPNATGLGVTWQPDTSNLTVGTNSHLSGHGASGFDWNGNAANPNFFEHTSPAGETDTGCTNVANCYLLYTLPNSGCASAPGGVQMHATQPTIFNNDSQPVYVTSSINSPGAPVQNNPPGFVCAFGQQSFFTVAKSPSPGIILGVPSWYVHWYENGNNAVAANGPTENFEGFDNIMSCSPDGVFCIVATDMNTNFPNNAGLGLDGNGAAFVGAFSVMVGGSPAVAPSTAMFAKNFTFWLPPATSLKIPLSLNPDRTWRGQAWHLRRPASFQLQ